MIGATNEPQAKALIEILKEEGGAPHSSVVAGGFKTSVLNAAFINGVKGHIFDFDDDHREGTMHPSVAVFPAVFALAEKIHASGNDNAASPHPRARDHDSHGRVVPGEVLLPGIPSHRRLRRVRRRSRLRFAPGIERQADHLRARPGGQLRFGNARVEDRRGLAEAVAAGPRSGARISSAQGRSSKVPDGVIRAYSFKDQYDYDRLTEGLGSKWEMADNSIKVHACCRFAAPIADCASISRDRESARARSARSSPRWAISPSGLCVRSRTGSTGRKRTSMPEFSLPYTVAVAIVRGRTGVDEFKGAALTDPEILALADKVTWELDPAAEALWPRHTRRRWWSR